MAGAAVALASRLAGVSGGLIGQHYRSSCSAIVAIHRRLTDRPEVVEAVESLAKPLRPKNDKYKVQACT
jgi:hypothetical protein